MDTHVGGGADESSPSPMFFLHCVFVVCDEEVINKYIKKGKNGLKWNTLHSIAFVEKVWDDFQ